MSDGFSCLHTECGNPLSSHSFASECLCRSLSSRKTVFRYSLHPLSFYSWLAQAYLDAYYHMRTHCTYSSIVAPLLSWLLAWLPDLHTDNHVQKLQQPYSVMIHTCICCSTNTTTRLRVRSSQGTASQSWFWLRVVCTIYYSLLSLLSPLTILASSQSAIPTAAGTCSSVYAHMYITRSTWAAKGVSNCIWFYSNSTIAI